VAQQLNTIAALRAGVEAQLTELDDPSNDDNDANDSMGFDEAQLSQLRRTLSTALDVELQGVVEAYQKRCADELIKNRAGAEEQKERIGRALQMVETAFGVFVRQGHANGKRPMHQPQSL
jgi:hypothetical protein